MRRMLLSSAMTAAILIGVATPATAITYVGSTSLTRSTVNFSITTDGTLGVLAASNITSWSVKTVVQPAYSGPAVDSFEFTPGDSIVQVIGGNLSATSTQLLFNYGSTAPAYMQFYSGSTGRFWFVESYSGGSGNSRSPGSYEVVYSPTDPLGYIFAGRTVLNNTLGTTVATGGIPEPASWAMLISGFGLVGAVARRRQRAVAT